MLKNPRTPAGPTAHPGPTTSLPALLQDGSGRRFRDLVQALLGISSRFVDLRERIGATVGLTGAQYSMLVSIPHLSVQTNGVTVGQLATHLHVSGTYVTAESKKLEARGDLRRIPNPEDRRSVLLQITARGEATLSRVLPMVCEINDTLFADLGREEFEVLRSRMLNLVEACDVALIIARRYALRPYA